MSTSATVLSSASSEDLWKIFSLLLLFVTQAGFMLLGLGLGRAGSAISVFMKGLLVFGVSTISYLAIGAKFLDPEIYRQFWTGSVDFSQALILLEHTLLASITAQISLGAMAGRTRLLGFFALAFITGSFLYPVSFLFLATKGFGRLNDFTDIGGVIGVHALGASIALAGALTVGGRLGKFSPEGLPRALPGHNLPLAAVGVWILLTGWLGFSVVNTSFEVGQIAYTFITLLLGAMSGTFGAWGLSWLLTKKVDPTFILTGTLGGLVSVSVGLGTFLPFESIAIGFISGTAMVAAILLMERWLRLDDPVGAVSIHGIGALVGVFALILVAPNKGLLTHAHYHWILGECLALLAVFVFGWLISSVIFLLMKKTMGLRIPAVEETKGIDMTEHGVDAYSGFQIFHN
jgi:Amt family ammonium transporter